MELDEQLDFFDIHADLAFERTLQALADDRKKIIHEARKRLSANYELYHDEGWFRTPTRLERDRLEEFADAVNYTVMQLKVLGL